MRIDLIPALGDNYMYLLHDSGFVAVVDPSNANVVNAVLEREGLSLNLILLTHHHPDHTAGVLDLRQQYDCPVVAAAGDAGRINEMTVPVQDGDEIEFGTQLVQVLHLPGHTLGHLGYWIPEAQAVFTGDTLFSLGCGRVFEGTAAMMWASLCRLRALPDETRIFCGHEYTLANSEFALAIDPGNPHLQARVAEVRALRAEEVPTIPTTIAVERLCNPFLRADDPTLQTLMGLSGADPVTVFAEIRRRKDFF